MTWSLLDHPRSTVNFMDAVYLILIATMLSDRE